MKITEEKKQELESVYQAFLRDERIVKMKDIQMHRGSNCYIHSFKVAKLAIKRALRHNKGDLYVILLGSILHDYYLYDWRKDKSKKRHHVTDHPYIAAKNAERDFGIHEAIQKVIQTHMWPFNIDDYPESKEARIISLADKSIYFREIICSRAYKAKREQKYLKQIAHLFDEFNENSEHV